MTGRSIPCHTQRARATREKAGSAAAPPARERQARAVPPRGGRRTRARAPPTKRSRSPTRARRRPVGRWRCRRAVVSRRLMNSHPALRAASIAVVAVCVWWGRRRKPTTRRRRKPTTVAQVLDATLFQFYNKNDGVRVTDLHQGIVWGTNTALTASDPRLVNRFDYDGDYGTVLNRFLMQSALGIPLTVYGTGGQTRALIHVMDTAKVRPRLGGRGGCFGAVAGWGVRESVVFVALVVFVARVPILSRRRPVALFPGKTKCVCCVVLRVLSRALGRSRRRHRVCTAVHRDRGEQPAGGGRAGRDLQPGRGDAARARPRADDLGHDGLRHQERAQPAPGGRRERPRGLEREVPHARLRADQARRGPLRRGSETVDDERARANARARAREPAG